jgi:hypothetical protein
MTTVMILLDVRPTSNNARYRCGAIGKSWIRDGDMSAQIDMRLEESRNSPTGQAVDGFRYTEMSNGNIHFIRSTGPIIGPHPREAGVNVDEYGG